MDAEKSRGMGKRNQKKRIRSLMTVIVFMITSLWTTGITYVQKGLAVSTDSGSNGEKTEKGESAGINSSNSLTTPDKETGTAENKQNEIKPYQQEESPLIITNLQDSYLDGDTITPITIKSQNAEDTISVEGLTDGLSFDTEKGEIHGIINIPEWDPASEEENSEEQKYIEAVVHVRNNTGTYHEEFIYINVFRDTDSDGIPDNIDTDDDGDGYSDREEELYGTDPKSSVSVPDPSNPPEGSFATFIEGKEIEPIHVREPQLPYTKLWVESLPDGLSYNPETRLITGIIEVGEWKENQKRKYFFMSFAESYTDGGITETQAWGNILEVLRDSDKDGVPDIEETPEDTTEEETSTVPGTKPETTKPVTTVPENTKPATTVPEVTKPESTVSVSTIPDTTVPEVTKPQTTKPESSSNAGTIPNESKPEDPDPSTQSSEEEPTTKTTIPTGTEENSTTETETTPSQTTDGTPVTTKSTSGSSASSDSVTKTTIPTKITTTSARTTEGRITSPIKNTPKNNLKKDSNTDLPDTGNQSDSILIILGIISLVGALIIWTQSKKKI